MPFTAGFGTGIGMKSIYKDHMVWVSTEILSHVRPHNELSGSIPVSAWVTTQPLFQRVKIREMATSKPQKHANAVSTHQKSGGK